jgi:non-ribosomal peptide synthase protein (TIGR01720 family)
VHHLAVDIVSWPILVADLEIAYRDLAAGRQPGLPAASTTFQQWAGRLAGYADSADLAAQAHHWLNLMPAHPLPVERPDGGNTQADAGTVSVVLDADTPTALVHTLPAGGQVRAEEVFLAGLAEAVTAWAGGNRVLMDLEGHGRADLFEDVDLSRTVGWFTCLYPVSLWLPAARDPAAVLRTVRDQLRSIPDRGIGYGLLRYASSDVDLAEALAELPATEILVNYTGHGSIEAPRAGAATMFTLPARQLTGGRETDRPRTHAIEVTGGVHNGQLHVHWTFSRARHDRATVELVARSHLDAIGQLVGAATGPAGTTAPRVPATSAVPDPSAVMAEHHVPGTAVVLIEDNRIVDAEGYGVLAGGGTEPVTADTLFQVGSISKHATALGVLRLVAEGAVALDEDVNRYLMSWRLPSPGVAGVVTARQLLSHVAGLTVARNSGYRPGEPMPGLLDLLRGEVPDSPAIAMELPPGEVFRKSNAHFWVLEQLMTDVTGEPFADLMRRLVFDPLGLSGTSFDQSFPERCGRPVARGHDERGTPVPGGWRVKPVLASTGMWSTAPDLARLLIEVRAAYLGGSGTLLPAPLARELFTVVHADGLYGLGTSVDDFGADIEYGHVGESVGYRAMMIGRVRAGTGFVVLTNADSGKEVHRYVATAFGEQQGRQFGQGQGRTELGYR